MKKKYEVLMPIEIEAGTIHHPPTVIELDDETAKRYAHALRIVKEQ